MKPIRFIDLFAGCGGLSEGFIQAGYTPIAHVEMNEAACYTLKTRMAYHWLKGQGKLDVYRSYLLGKLTRDEFYQAIPSSVLESVINEEVGKETIVSLFERIDADAGNNPIDLIIGGPPCQTYSLVGRASDKKHMRGDPRNYLFRFYIKFLTKYKPKCFVFENVVGLLSAVDENGKKYLDLMIEGFKSAGYATDYKVINTKDLGIPQARKRVIILGVLGVEKVDYPTINREDFSYTINDMFAGLPPIRAGESAKPFGVHIDGNGRNALEATAVLDEELPVTQHQVRPNNETDLEIYRRAVKLWNETGKRLSYEQLPKELRTRTNLTSFRDRYKVVSGTASASHTVIAHIAKDGHYYIHPDIIQNRSLSVREAARLQTFPDNYYFESCTHQAGRAAPYRQIGNAVPVMLAKKIADAMKGFWNEK